MMFEFDFLWRKGSVSRGHAGQTDRSQYHTTYHRPGVKNRLMFQDVTG